MDSPPEDVTSGRENSEKKARISRKNARKNAASAERLARRLRAEEEAEAVRAPHCFLENVFLYLYCVFLLCTCFILGIPEFFSLFRSLDFSRVATSGIGTIGGAGRLVACVIILFHNVIIQ